MRRYYITTDYPSDIRLIQLANRFRLIPWPSRDNPVWTMRPPRPWPKNCYALTARTDQEGLCEQLRLPLKGVIDTMASDASVACFFQNERRAAPVPSLSLLLTGQALYTADIAFIFTRALADRLNFSAADFDAIRMVVHESLVNALIHGNLRLSSSLRRDGKHFFKYARMLTDRLNDPTFAQKSVRIRAQWTDNLLEIKIQDEGAGYCVTPTARARSELYAASGRGLKIIADVADACTVSDYGREITLSFRRTDKRSFLTSGGKPYLMPHRPDFSRARVFVAKKNPVRVQLVTQLLKSMGVTFIKTGDTDFAKVRDILQFNPDLVILDVLKTEDPGVRLLEHLKADPDGTDIPVLAKIPAAAPRVRREVLIAGAVDFIEKPIVPAEFLTRVGVHLQNKLLIKNLQTQLSNIKNEQYAAQQMQIGLLPSVPFLNALKKEYHLEIAHYFVPSSVLGGDFWQIFKLSKNRLCFYVSDFSGHGMSAALNTFRLHTLTKGIDISLASDPAELLRFLNERLYDLLPRGQFTTFFCGVIDVAAQTITYAGAGSVPPVLMHQGREVYLKARGVPLGIQTHPVYENQTHAFQPGDFLILFSDAAIEGKTRSGRRLSYAWFVRMMRPSFKLVSSSVRWFLDDVVKRFFTVSPPPPTDDLTLVCLKFNE